MSNGFSLSQAIAVSVLSGLFAMASTTALAKTPKPTGLFADSQEPALVKPPRNALKGKSRAVKVDRKLLRKGRFFVSLPDGVSYEVVRSVQEELGKDKFGWVGHANGDPGSRAVFGVSGSAVAGTLAYNGRLYKLEPRANGSHVLSEVKPTDPAPELDPIPVADNALVSPDPGTSQEIAADVGGSIIDVLVAYTPAVSALYGPAGAEALVLQAVAEANQAYANSGMSTRINLVRSVQTNYVEAGDMNTDLSRLRSSSDGYMDELHALRETYGADLVNLIENEPQYCGLAYRMATLSASFSFNAFSVVHHGCATGYYSFAHEIGHNQGAHHDAANASGAIYPYAYGYLDPNNAFRTIMSYNCPGGCTRIGYFSNAEIAYNGKPTGYPGAAENADAIDNTAATVASFRQSVTPIAPAAPSGTTATAVSASQIDLTWIDTANNESGFRVERSLDGQNFSQIATLAANATSYQDNSLSELTSYYYRVRAWNGSGNSGYSGIATATTYPILQIYDQFASSETSAGGSVTGSFLDTQSEDGILEIIRETTSAGTARNRYSYLEHYWAIPVLPGALIELSANVTTKAANQTFTFAYSTTPGTRAENPGAWVDMFTISSSTTGAQQFRLPSELNGPVYISVRDNNRSKGVSTSDSVKIDRLAVQTIIPVGC